jgi:hypothetical protein
MNLPRLYVAMQIERVILIVIDPFQTLTQGLNKPALIRLRMPA